MRRKIRPRIAPFLEPEVLLQRLQAAPSRAGALATVGYLRRGCLRLGDVPRRWNCDAPRGKRAAKQIDLYRLLAQFSSGDLSSHRGGAVSAVKSLRAIERRTGADA